MSRLEFESQQELRDYLAGTNDLTGAVFQSIDLTPLLNDLQNAVLIDNVLLGCNINSAILELFNSPIIFPILPDVPFNPFRSTLYTPDELLGSYEIGNPISYESTVDGKSYQHYVDTGKSNASDVVVTLARRLHDHAISDALQEFLTSQKAVAIMGGHSMKRNDPT